MDSYSWKLGQSSNGKARRDVGFGGVGGKPSASALVNIKKHEKTVMPSEPVISTSETLKKQLNTENDVQKTFSAFYDSPNWKQ